MRETPTHLANAQTIAPNPVKYLVHHAGFVRHHLIAGLASPHMLVDVAVAIGRSAAHMHHTGARGMSFPATMAFDNLGPLILGPHPLHVEQQIIFRAAAQLPV